MELKIKLLKWSAGVPVAMLHEDIAQKLGVHLMDRITIKKGKHEISTIIDTIDNNVIKHNELAVSSELQELMDLHSHDKVDINLVSSPTTLEFIKKKLNGYELSQKEIMQIVKDIVSNTLSEPEIALFVSAMYEQGMKMKETIFLVRALLETGSVLKFKNRIVVDKHSIGGIPGNRTTPIVVSICAAGGLTIPKTSSRAITTAAGTADVIETIAKVDFSLRELKHIVEKTNGCFVWGGFLGMAPADSKIIQIEKRLKIDPESQLLASIMSKKLASGAKYLLIDIPYGKSAKVTKLKALKLKKKFEIIGKSFHKKLKVVLTDGSQPMGTGVGPALEMQDVLDVLKLAENRPLDLENKSLMLAGELFEMTGKAKKSKGKDLAKKILYSGKAFDKFNQIVLAQKGKVPDKLQEARYHRDIFSSNSGKVLEIDNKKINSLARLAGCPVDKFAGLKIYVHLSNRVSKGEKIMTIHAESLSRLKEAILFFKKQKPIIIK